MAINNTLKNSKVIVDIQQPAIDLLTEKEKEYLKTLNEPKRTRFIYMNKEYRNLIMNGYLNKEDEAIMWEYGAKLAFQYSNSSIKQQKIVNGTLKTLIKGFLFAALICYGMDLYFNTYAKSRQLRLETVMVGQQKWEIDPNQQRKINKGQERVLSPMKFDNYVKLIQEPNFKCGELKNLSDTFVTPDGTPLCKTNKLGDTYIIGYVEDGNWSKLVFNVIHQGKIYNVDMDKELGISTKKIQGADNVGFSRIQNSFAASFPDVVREFKANAVLESKQTVKDKVQ